LSSQPGQLLAGLRLVDISRTAAGARVSHFFADYGAEVLFVERPGGSPLRRDPGWPYLGRGKQSLEADLRSNEGLELVRTLARDADVLVETFRPGVLDRMGLGYESLRAHNPGLVLTSITGFGRKGPWAGLKGYEGIVMAKIGGFEEFRRGSRRPGPTFAAVPYCSYTAAQMAIQGTMAALFEREQSGEGQQVDANLVQGFATMDPWCWYQEFVADRFPGALTMAEAYDADGNPNSWSIFTLLVALTADGVWLQFSQNFPHLFAALARAVGVEDIMDSPKWTGMPDFEDVNDRVSLWNRMLTAARAMTYEDWQAKFDSDRNVFAEVFRRGAEVLRHPQLVDNGWVAAGVDPTYGLVTQPARMVHIEGEPKWAAPPAPGLNEHDPAVLEPRPIFREPHAGMAPAGRLPLEGVTIVDLCMMFAAPYATSMLSDLGARVIHVERLEGDPIRVLGGFPEVGGMKVMQGKKSIAIDLSQADGREIVMRLLSRSDAVLHGFRAGVAQKMGLDGASLRTAFPHLFYMDATGYGTTGLYGDRPAYANSIAAAAGITLRNAGDSLGDAEGVTLPEIKERSKILGSFTASRGANADGLSAVTAASALMMGILAQKRGQSVQMETTMLSSTSHVVYDDVITYEGKVPVEPDPLLLGIGSLYRLYEASDGWIFLACVTDQEWAALVGVLRQFVDLDQDGRFSSAEARQADDGALAEILAQVFAQREAGYWEASLTDADVACAVSATETSERTLMGEIARQSDYVTTVSHPTYDDHPRLTPMVRFSRSSTVAGPACLAGQHTESILAEVGYGEDEVAALRDKQVIL
jgi:crotonobetainyl-CoA:carnitine CoA-transferase CaiB-like acyl-CoA transferase